MIGEASGHRRGGPAPGVGPTRRGGAARIDRPEQSPALRSWQRATRQRAPSAGQRGQTRPEGRGQSFAVGRLDDSVARRAPPARLHACRGAIDPAACGLAPPAPLGARDDVRDQDLAPRTPPGPAALPRGRGLAQGLPYGPQGRHHALGPAPQGTTGRTARDARDQPSDQGHGPRRAARAPQPHARLDPHGPRHPHDAARLLDAAGIGLDLAEVPRWLAPMCLDGLPLAASACAPRCARPRVAPPGHPERLHRPAMGKQREEPRHQVARSAPALQDGPACGGKGLATLRADEAPVLARREAQIPLAGVASGGTRPLGAAWRWGVHAGPPRSVGERT
jgi:hypothetical protein